MKLSSKILFIGLGISVFIILCIFALTLPLGWTGMSEVFPPEVLKMIIFGVLGVGLILILVGFIAKVIRKLKK